MRIAIISDIHSNLPALEAVMNRIRELGAERVYCLGDTIGYGPYPNECVDIVREQCAVVLKGNHDSGLVGETSLEDFNNLGYKALLWTREHIRAENTAYLAALPLTSVDNDLTLVHASPSRPASWQYVFTLRAAQQGFPEFSSRLCFIGHTHVPVIIGEDATVNRYRDVGRFLINVGSVGQPRDGVADAAFGMFDAASASYVLHRVPYDIEKTAQAIKEAGLPEFLALRLSRGI
jgi:diadenosine tetraphosphatase ApaH/serine/threonine PP2A family protein phosphatase